MNKVAGIGIAVVVIAVVIVAAMSLSSDSSNKITTTTEVRGITIESSQEQLEDVERENGTDHHIVLTERIGVAP